MQNFRVLGAPPPDPVPPAAGGLAPKPPASGGWGLRPQTPTAAPPLRISSYASGCIGNFFVAGTLV